MYVYYKEFKYYFRAWHNGYGIDYCTKGPKFEPPPRANPSTQIKRVMDVGSALTRIWLPLRLLHTLVTKRADTASTRVNLSCISGECVPCCEAVTSARKILRRVEVMSWVVASRSLLFLDAYIEQIVNLTWHVDHPNFPIGSNSEIKLNDMIIVDKRYEKCAGPYPMFRGSGQLCGCFITYWEVLTCRISLLISDG